MALTRPEKLQIAGIFTAALNLTATGCDTHRVERERSALHDAFIIANVTSPEQKKAIWMAIRNDVPCSELRDPDSCEQVKDFYHSKLGSGL